MSDVAGLNRMVQAGRARAEAHLPELERVYTALLRNAGHDAARGFTQQTETLVAAVRPWEPPPDDLVDGEQLAQEAAPAVSPVYEKILQAVSPAADLGIAFDIHHAASQALLAGVAQRLGSLGEAIREQVAESIRDGYAQGWSVAKTAKAIMEKVDSVTPGRAAMLARTDLNALSNGASLAAAQAVGVGAKTWLATEDERTRETHSEADGQTVPIDQPFTVGGEEAQYPGDPDLSDEEAINCRCTVTYCDSLTAAADGPDVSNLAMVAVYPEADEANAISLPDGHPAEKMHVTLVFLGDADSFDPADVLDALTEAASETQPLSGAIGGIGKFGDNGVGAPLIALPDVQGLSSLRERVVSALGAHGIVSPSEHGWLPHITLDYADADAPLPDAGVIGKPITFNSLSMSIADKRTDIPLTPEGGEMNDQTLSAAASGDTNQLEQLSTEELRALESEVASLITKRDLFFLSDFILTAAAGGPTRWQATLLVEGQPTEDGRLLLPDSISWRQLPLTLGLMLETPHSYSALAPTCGRIDLVWRAGDFIQASGVFLDDSEDEDLAGVARQAVEAVASRAVRGISVDLAVLDAEDQFIPNPADESSMDKDGEDELPPEVGEDLAVQGLDKIVEAIEMEEPDGRWVWAVKEGVIGSACIVPFAAIAQATIEVLTAAGGWQIARATRPLEADCGCDDTPVAVSLVAAAAPLAPPTEWFADPGLDKPTPFTVTDDGRVFGHVALWNTCHEGFPGRCVRPFRSNTGYRKFLNGELRTADGTRVNVGKITLAAGHASTKRGVTEEQARAHYDNTATVGAFVAAGDDQHGIWVSGALRSDLSQERVRDLMTNPLSGDWRNGELVAAHAVIDPGFPVLRASGMSELLDPPEEDDGPVSPLTYLRPGARAKVA